MTGRNESKQRKAALLTAAGHLSQKEVAQAVGISVTTLRNWSNKDPDFMAAVGNVRRSLLNKRQARMEQIEDVMYDRLADIFSRPLHELPREMLKQLLPTMTKVFAIRVQAAANAEADDRKEARQELQRAKAVAQGPIWTFDDMTRLPDLAEDEIVH